MITKLEHRFVETVPEVLEDGILYISTKFRVIIHACCCGCKNKVVTPLSPVRWKMIFDGKTISLDPSIGNWNFECESHYWINNSRVELARKWNDNEITKGKLEEKKRRAEYYSEANSQNVEVPAKSDKTKSRKHRIIKWLKNIW